MKLVVLFIAVSVIASICSMLLGLVCSVLLHSLIGSENIEDEGLVIVAAIFYQVPVMFGSWIIAEIAMLKGSRGEQLYRIIINSVFLISTMVVTVFCKIAWPYDFVNAIIAGATAIVSAVSAILVFRQHLKAIK